MKHGLYVLSGPSGVGKGTLAKMLVERGEVALSISCTTRKPREGEVDGREYFFLSREEFQKKIKQNGFYEYSEHFGNLYGTPRDYVEKTLQSKDVLLEIDVNGGTEVKKNDKNAILIFVKPPSFEELRARLKGRHSESEENIETRLSRLDYEYAMESAYDYTVVNDDLEKAYEEIAAIIKRNKGDETI